MAKAIVKKYSLSANGILVIDDDVIGIENPDLGEGTIDLRDLFADFADRSVKINIVYDEDYGVLDV